ncbi:MAG TPA: hypothetical protein LFV92_00765 [Rickettsia endosymbiont of Ceroptres masudai]|nr:hypothetical protein [Rickettsia endosymbiont of Ceroptres masudai]
MSPRNVIPWSSHGVTTEQVVQATYKYLKIIKRLCKQIIQNQTLIKQLSKSGGLLLL